MTVYATHHCALTVSVVSKLSLDFCVGPNCIHRIRNIFVDTQIYDLLTYLRTYHTCILCRSICVVYPISIVQCSFRYVAVDI